MFDRTSFLIFYEIISEGILTKSRFSLAGIFAVLFCGFAAAAASGQNYDLAVTDLAVTTDNKVAVTVTNTGRTPLPETVWTVRNAQSPSVTIRVNGSNWGGAAIWSSDTNRSLRNPGGRHTFVMNYVIRGEVRIDAIVNVFGAFVETNTANNTFSRTLRPGAAGPPPSTGTPPRPQPSSGPKGSFLNSTANFDLNKIKTIHAMQEHIQWVSMENENEAVMQLQANGFTVLGGGMISDGGISGERIRCYVVTKGDAVVVAFRGTKAVGRPGQTFINGLVTDGNVKQVSPEFFSANSPADQRERGAKVHWGFNNGYMKLRPAILRALESQKGKRLFAFGHSLGGALATLFAADVALNRPGAFSSITHIVSGSPRVGDETFRTFFESRVPNNLRFMINNDPVPTIPNYISPLKRDKYQHVGRLLVVGKDSIIVQPGDVDVTFNISQFDSHDNELYLRVSRSLMDRATANPSVYSIGTRHIINAGNKERELADRYVKRF